MLGHRISRRELSEMTVHPENIVSGREDSLEAESSCPAESGERCGKKRRWKKEPLAILFDIPVRIDSSTRVGPMPSWQASTCGPFIPPCTRWNEGNLGEGNDGILRRRASWVITTALQP
jgi:hypothetical protein